MTWFIYYWNNFCSQFTNPENKNCLHKRLVEVQINNIALFRCYFNIGYILFKESFDNPCQINSKY
ncbi:hypothetical protein BpHYR1_020816 [Brachionus plicatilis]|uniref:Uncharacterized protein n=1 Tax=Brachionus plicatilis TaxID=10195 RepID=A0A3M7PSM3_BRAPC|nr:hypothetical protein BpHYR1_020816 [Brachionus plicatilis]